MATVFRKEKPNGELSPYWYASYKRADGKWTKKSTKKKNRNDALQIALAWETVENEAAGGSLSRHRALDIVNETLRRIGETAIETAITRTLLKNWLKGRERSTSGSTAKEYQIVIDGFLSFLGDRADMSLEAIGEGDVIKWREYLLTEKKLNPTTINNRVKILRMPFEEARQRGLIRTNPASKGVVRPLTVTERMEKGTFTLEQVKDLLSVANREWNGVIRIAYFTGARLRDITNLRWRNVDLEAGTIKFTPMKTARKDKKVTIPIHPDVESWLLDQPAGDDGDAHLFPSLADRGTGGRNGLSYEFQKLMKEAGIATRYEYESADGDGRKRIALSFHSFRHSFTSNLANAGVNQEIRQKLTGHASAEMNALYTHHELEVLREATKQLPRLS